MADSSDTQNAGMPSLEGEAGADTTQPEHLYAANGQTDPKPRQEIAATVNNTPSSMPMNIELNLRQQVQGPLVKRPLYNPSVARMDTPGSSVTASQSSTALPPRRLDASQKLSVAPQPRQTIEIAPHPTTNRYPWNPVSNPTMPVPVVPAPSIETPYAPPVAAVPVPSEMRSPVSRPEPPKPAPVPPAAEPPAAIPIPEPAAVAIEPSPPVSVPHATDTNPPDVPPKTFQDIKPPDLPISMPQPAPAELTPAPVDPPKQPVRKPRTSGQGVHIYGESTREAWHVFKPNQILRVLKISLAVILLVSSVIIWIRIGAPTSPMDVPFLKPLLESQ